MFLLAIGLAPSLAADEGGSLPHRDAGRGIQLLLLVQIGDDRLELAYLPGELSRRGAEGPVLVAELGIGLTQEREL